jgi:hypothetical protein
MTEELKFLKQTRGLNRPHNKTNNMRTKPTLNFTGASLIVSVWHYSATYSRDAVEKIALQHFADVIQIEGGRMDWTIYNTNGVFSRRFN